MTARDTEKSIDIEVSQMQLIDVMYQAEVLALQDLW